MRRLVIGPKVVTSIRELIQGKISAIKYKDGYNVLDITRKGKKESAYTRIMHTMLEMMIADVIEGHIVYFNKADGAMFYVDYEPADSATIRQDNLKEDRESPLVDFKVTNYRFPFIAFDPGSDKTPCKVRIPMHLYIRLIENVNSGKKYIKSSKEFWFNRGPWK